MPASSAIRFALAGAVLGVLGAIAAFAFTGGEASEPDAAPGTQTVTTGVTETTERTETTTRTETTQTKTDTSTSTATVTAEVEVTVDTVTEETVASYSSCEEAATAAAKQAEAYDGSPASQAALGAAAFTTAEQCTEAMAEISGEVAAAGASEDAAALVPAVAAYGSLAQKQASAATKLAIGLASGSRSASKRAASSYVSRTGSLDRSARTAKGELARARAKAG